MFDLVDRADAASDAPLACPGELEDDVEGRFGVGGESLNLVARVLLERQRQRRPVAQVQPFEGDIDEVRSVAAVDLVCGDDEHYASRNPTRTATAKQ